MGKKYLDIKENSLESSVYNVLHGIQETVKKEKLDPVGKEDGDIDNDGDKDASDKYLAKRRKTISKAIKKDKKEGLEDSPNTANSQHLCAKNVVHENWGNGTPISGQHAEPDAEGAAADELAAGRRAPRRPLPAVRTAGLLDLRLTRRLHLASGQAHPAAAVQVPAAAPGGAAGRRAEPRDRCHPEPAFRVGRHPHHAADLSPDDADEAGDGDTGDRPVAVPP